MQKGQIVKVENKVRKFGSLDSYYAVNCDRDGQTLTYLFTENELTDAQKRCEKNVEDLEQIEDMYIDTTGIKYAFILFAGLIIGYLIRSVI